MVRGRKRFLLELKRHARQRTPPQGPTKAPKVKQILPSTATWKRTTCSSAHHSGPRTRTRAAHQNAGLQGRSLYLRISSLETRQQVRVRQDRDRIKSPRLRVGHFITTSPCARVHALTTQSELGGRGPKTPTGARTEPSPGIDAGQGKIGQNVLQRRLRPPQLE